MKRRTFIKGTLAAAATASIPIISIPASVRKALSAQGKIKFASTASVSGAFAENGKFGEMGSRLAVKTVGKVLGRDIDYITIDTEGNAGKAVRKVQEAINQDGVRFFCGGTLSSTGLAIGKEVASAGGVYITPVGADEVTGSECNKSTFRWSVPTYGAIEQTVRPLIGSFPNAKRWYTITPEYVFGEALLNNAKNVFKEKNIEHVGNSYHSLQEKEFSGYLTNAMAAKPDVLLLLNFGGQSSASIRQAVSFGMKNNMMILLAWSSGLEQFRSLGPDTLDGIYLGAQYWHEVDTPGNNALLELCRKEYDINPNYPIAADYTGARIIFDAITAAGSDDPAAVISKMEGYKYQGPTGEETVRAFDHQVIKDYYLLKGKPAKAMKDKDSFVDVVSSGKSFASQEESLCKMS